MGYPSDMVDPRYNSGFERERKRLESELEEHRKSSKCTKKQDCQICKRLREQISVSHGNLA